MVNVLCKLVFRHQKASNFLKQEEIYKCGWNQSDVVKPVTYAYYVAH